jgi:hypothetical protein
MQPLLHLLGPHSMATLPIISQAIGARGRCAVGLWRVGDLSTGVLPCLDLTHAHALSCA